MSDTTLTQGSKDIVLVVGSTGTVGSVVTDTLVESGSYEVHAIARQHIVTCEGVIPHEIDLKRARLSNELSGIEFDYIVDCAQPRYVDEDDTDFGVEHIRNLESLCTRRTKRLVYSSGVWIYGHQQKGVRIDENTPLNPFKYARPRIPVVQYLRESSKYNWVQMILPSIIYGAIGPLQDIKACIQKGNADVIDDESIEWSVIERSDLGKAYLAVIENESCSSEYLLAEDDSVPIVRFYEHIANLLGSSIIRRSARELRNTLSDEDFEIATSSQPVDSSLIRKELGWENKYSFYRDSHVHIKDKSS